MLADEELDRRLDAMPVAEPPRGLHGEIMDAVAGLGPRASGLGSREPALGRWNPRTEDRGPRTRRSRWLAVAYAAAAMLVLVVLVMYPRHDRVDVEGTMAPRWPVVERYSNDQATLTVTRRGEFYALEAVIHGARPLTTAITWDEKSLAATGVSLGFDASFGKDQVRFTLRDPSQRAGVIVRRVKGATTADVRVSIADHEVLRAAVPLD